MIKIKNSLGLVPTNTEGRKTKHAPKIYSLGGGSNE